MLERKTKASLIKLAQRRLWLSACFLLQGLRILNGRLHIWVNTEELLGADKTREM